MKHSRNILIIFIFSLVPLLWFRDGCLIAGGDAPILLDPVNYLRTFVRYPVTDMVGVHPFEICLIIPFLLFYYLMCIAGVSLIVTEKLFFVGNFFLTGVSMYYLMSVLTRKNTGAYQWGKLAGAVFYMFNYFVILVNPMLTQFIAYALLPLILGLYIKGLEGKGLFLRRMVLFVLALSFLPLAFTNPPFLSMIFIILAFYTMYHLVFVSRFKDVLRVVGFVFASGILYVLLNIWFLGVWYFYFKTQGIASETILPGYWNPGSTLDRTFVLQGSWAWNEVYFPYFYDYFEKTAFKIFIYLFPLMIFSSLLAKIRSIKIYFFIGLVFAGIFLAKGRWGLCGWVYAFLFDNVPMFWIYREPHTKFTLFTVLGYAVLIGFILSQFLRYFSVWMRHKKWHPRRVRRVLWGTCAAMVGMICVGAWPIFTGGIIADKRQEIPTYHVQVPECWNQAADFFRAEEDDIRIFELPENKWASVWLGWQHGFAAGGNPVSFLFDKSTIHSPVLNLVSRRAYYVLEEETTPEVYKLLQMLNVKYLLQRNDYLWKTLETDSPSRVREMLKQQKKIVWKQTFGELDIYQVQEPSLLFSTAEGLTGVLGGGASLDAMTRVFDIDRMTFYFFRQFSERADNEYFGRCSRIVFSNSTFDDFVKCFIDKRFRMVPADALRWGDADSLKGWVPIVDLTKDPLNAAERKILNGSYLSAGKAVFTASGASLKMKHAIDKDAVCRVFVRWIPLAKDAVLELKCDDKQVGVLKANTGKGSRLAWQEVGRIFLKTGEHEVTLALGGGRVLVDEIIILPEDESAHYVKELARKCLNGGKSLEYLFYTQGGPLTDGSFLLLRDGMYRIDLVFHAAGDSIENTVLIDGAAVNMKGGNILQSAEVLLKEGSHVVSGMPQNAVIRIASEERSPRHVEREITYEKQGAARYLVRIRKSAEPYYLVFKTPYDVNWELYQVTGDAAFLMKKFDLFSCFRARRHLKKNNAHCIVNGFANGYYIDKPKESDVYFLENRFQRVFEAGTLISLVSLCAVVFIFILKKGKQ